MTAAVEVLPPERTGPDHPEWFTARRAGVTASEIAAVLGLSPHTWESPFSLYWLKKAGVGEQPDNPDMRWGRRLESYVADEFADRHPEYRVHPAGLYAHPDRPWQMASPDRLLTIGGPGGGRLVAGLECKTDYSWDDWGPEGSDQIPVWYRAQTIWQADVLGVQRVHLPVGVGRTYREYVVDHDPDDAAFMRDAAQTFLDRLDCDRPPDVDGAPSTRRALKALHRSLDDTEQRVPRSLAADWAAACKAVRKAKTRKDTAENRLRDRMGRAKYAVTRDGTRVATRQVYPVKEHVRAASTTDKLVPAKETP